MITAHQVMARAESLGYRLTVKDDRLGYIGPKGSEISVSLLSDIRAHQRELRIYARVAEHRRARPSCEVCGLLLSINVLGDLCGRCVALPSLVQQALRLGAKRLVEDPGDPKFQRWNRMKAQLLKEGKKVP